VAGKRSTKFGRKPPWEVERKENMKVRHFGMLAHRYDSEIEPAVLVQRAAVVRSIA
jgi:hypothetical protein